MRYRVYVLLCFMFFGIASKSQNSTITKTKPAYWQQHVDYKMEIVFDVNNYQYKGKQELTYTNNSPDELTRVYYHLYFNAFQPGSEMDIRSQTTPFPDSRIGDRIGKLKPDEIGYIKVNSLKQNGIDVKYETVGTVLEVDLDKPIQPGESVVFPWLSGIPNSPNMILKAGMPTHILKGSFTGCGVTSM